MTNRINSEESGQAILELSFTFVVLAVLVFGIVDFGRAIYDAAVMKNLSGESSNLASRGSSAATAAQSVTTHSALSIDLKDQGCVIVTVVTNTTGTLQVTDQASQCAIPATSKVGCLQGQSGCGSSNATLPSAAASALQSEVSGSSLFVTEIFYSYNNSTPLASFLQGGALPSQLYSVAYY
jgi:Flp pilus assembly protein TadG